MEYIPLGTGSCVPDYKKNSSGAFLIIKDKLFLIDCGTGVLHTMTKTEFDYKNIDAIFITHLHIDHVNDFPALLFALKNDPQSSRKRDLSVFAPKGFRKYYQKLIDLFGETIISPNYEVKITELANTEIEYKSVKIKTKKTHHTEHSIGFRWEMGKKIFCSTGDTGYNENVVELCRSADTAVMECSAPEEIVLDKHLSPERIGKIAKKANVERVIVNHRYPVMDTIPIKKIIRNKFQGKINLAQVGEKYTI